MLLQDFLALICYQAKILFNPPVSNRTQQKHLATTSHKMFETNSSFHVK